MRVLYFHQYFSTREGATGTRSYEFARGLVRRGHQVVVVCATTQLGIALATEKRGGRERRGSVEGIEVIQLDLGYSNHFGLARRAWLFTRFAWSGIRVAFRERHDVLFATSTPLTIALPGIARKLLGARQPFIFEVRDLWPELPKAMGVVRNPAVLGLLSMLERLAYRLADACVGLSPGIVEGIRRRAPAGRRIAMISNACDLELFRPGKRADLRLAGAEPEDFVAVFCGAHGLANGLDAALDAAQLLGRRRRRDIKLAFIGDGKLKPALVARAKREQLDNCLFFDPMPKHQLAEVLGAADCGLMLLADVPAFYYGTSPNKFFDYISAGLPVINNYPGWIADLIVRHECGLAVPPGDPNLLADALCRLADGPKARSAAGRNARLLAERDFARERLAGRFADFVESVAGPGINFP